MVTTPEDVTKLAERLGRSSVIGVDTEADSMYHYQEKVCLIQFTDADGDIILDPLSAGPLDVLKPIFENRDIVKIFHGSDYDVVSLKRDFGFHIHNLFDTLIAAQFLDLKGLGLANLIDRYFGQPLDKKFQRHDWSRRPLLDEHLDYARGDTHWLAALREILIRSLKRNGKLAHHIEECEILEKREWKRKPFDKDGWSRIKRSGQLDDDEKRVLRQLYLYRDEQARSLDRPPYKVIGDHLLLDIARAMPSSERELDDLFPRKRALKRRHASNIVDAVHRGLDDESSVKVTKPSKTPERSSSGGLPDRLAGRVAERVFLALKDWRNHLVAHSSEFNTYSVASNSILKSIARARPLTLEELAQVTDVRKWQVQDHGTAILALLHDEAPAATLDKKPSKPAKKRRSRSRSRKPASES
jgi:ribonuclease D